MTFVNLSVLRGLQIEALRAQQKMHSRLFFR